MARWKCRVCSYVYDEEKGEILGGIPGGTRFSDLPEGWVCPQCGAGKEFFDRIPDEAERPLPSTTVSDVIISELERWGISLIFGMPGGSALPLVEAVRKNPEMRYIVVRHEQTAALAASAYNKLTGNIAACLTIAGPGATNLATGLYDAKEDRASVLALNGQVRTQYTGPGGFQEIDQDAFFRPITVFNNTIFDPETAVKLITRALRHAVIQRGVAQISIPNNVQREPLEASICLRESCVPNDSIVPGEEELEKAAGVINTAKSPVIVAGAGALGAADSLLAIAERLQAPIVTTLRAKGIFPDDTPWLVGIHGSIGTPHARTVVSESDLLITCGVGFSQLTDLPADRPTVQIDIDPLQLGKDPFAVALWGNCRLVLPRLLRRLHGRDEPSVRERIARMKREWMESLDREADPDAVPIRPPYIMKVLSEALPEDAVISLDVGENGWWFGRNFRMKRQRFVMSWYLGTMGFGLPGAIAAKLAYPDRTVVCITGDGGFSMVMGDFVTAVKYRLPMVVLVMNNRDLAMIRVEQAEEHYPPFATELLNPDFAAFGESSGGAGIRVDRPDALGPALKKALAMDVPVIIDVATDRRRFV